MAAVAAAIMAERLLKQLVYIVILVVLEVLDILEVYQMGQLRMEYVLATAKLR